MIKVHHIIRVLNAAVGARFRFIFPNNFTVFQSKPCISSQISILVSPIMIFNDETSTSTAIGVTKVFTDILKSKLSYRKIDLTARTYLILYGILGQSSASQSRI